MKTLNEYVKLPKSNLLKLKQAYMDACCNKKFQEYVSMLPIEEDLLIKYTSILEDASIEFYHCQNCKGLAFCQNKMKGYLLTPTKENRTINFSYVACPFEKQKLKDTLYQKYISYYNVPEDIKKASLANSYKDDKNRIPIIKYIDTFLDNYSATNKPKGLYLHGSFGSGKTYLIAAMFNELAKRNIRSAIVYFPEFLRHLKSSFNDDFEEKFNYIRKVPILLLDDIGAENLTSWSRDEILGPILQYRMDEHLPTFFTSNLDITELELHLSGNQGIDKLKARRIVERIKQLTNDLELISKNRRD